MGLSSKKKAKGKGRGEGGAEKPRRCIRCSTYVKDAATGRVCPGCEQMFCSRCVKVIQVCREDGARVFEGPEFMKCHRGGCPVPERCMACSVGITIHRLTWHNEERERRGLDPLPIPNAASYDSKLIMCANNMSGTCAGIDGKNCYCLSCTNMVIGTRGFHKRYVMEYCPQCKSNFCIPCLESNDLNKVDICNHCEKKSCRGCTLFKFCPNCDGSYCNQECSANIQEACSSCHRVVCIGCDPKYNIEHSLCGKCYKPCTNPECPNEELTNTKRCGACRTTRYCGKECQVAMWPDHEEECPKIKKEGEYRRMEAKAKRRTAKTKTATAESL